MLLLCAWLLLVLLLAACQFSHSQTEVKRMFVVGALGITSDRHTHTPTHAHMLTLRTHYQLTLAQINEILFAFVVHQAVETQ